MHGEDHVELTLPHISFNLSVQLWKVWVVYVTFTDAHNNNETSDFFFLKPGMNVNLLTIFNVGFSLKALYMKPM